MHIDIEQTATGIKGSPENRVLDWKDYKSKDLIFGAVTDRSQLAQLQEMPNILCTRLDDATQMEDVKQFLVGKVLADGSPCDGFLEEEVIQCWTVNEKWTAEQIWGFEMINGERRHTRRTVVKAVDKGTIKKARLVYTFEGTS